MSSVDISGIPKANLLTGLFNRAVTAARSSTLHVGPLGVDEMSRFLSTNPTHSLIFDYFRGRPLKVDLSGDVCNPAKYDYINGEGSFRRVVGAVRKSLTADASMPVSTDMSSAVGSMSLRWNSLLGYAEVMPLVVQRPNNEDFRHLRIGVLADDVDRMVRVINDSEPYVLVEVDDRPRHAYPDHIKMCILLRDATMKDPLDPDSAFDDPQLPADIEMMEIPDDSVLNLQVAAVTVPDQISVVSISTLTADQLKAAKGQGQSWKLGSVLLDQDASLIDIATMNRPSISESGPSL